MCQLIRALVQFLVSQLLVFKTHCDGFRTPRRFPLEHLLDAEMTGIICDRRVPFRRNVAPLDEAHRFLVVEGSLCE